ncbi:MAG: hypothetical protein QM820_10225 [Minicystis sp.]
MEISFVRVRGQRDRIYVRRSDGSEVSWVFPTYGDGLPHDLVHLVVEAAFGLRRGFWGRVDAGVDPARVNDEANRRGGPDKYRGFGDDQREILLAEALAAAPWSDAEVSGEGLCEALAEGARRAGMTPPEAVTPARVVEVRAALAGLAARWRAMAAKGTIALRFTPGEPSKSFAEIVRAAADRA